MRKALPISCLLWLGMASSVLGAQGRPQPATPLFTDLPSAVAPRVQSAEAVRSRPVQIALESLAEADKSQAAGVRGRSRVTLNLFPDVEVTAVLKEVTPTDIGFAWVGTLAGIPGSHVTLVYGKGILVRSSFPNASLLRSKSIWRLDFGRSRQETMYPCRDR